MSRSGSRYRLDWGIISGALFFIVLGGGFAGFGFYQLITTYHYVSEAYEAPAVVVRNSESCDDDGCTWWPTLAFTDANGTEVERHTRHGSSNFGYSVGAEVDVLVNDAYGYVRMTGGSDLWLLGGAFAALGSLPFVIGFWLLFTQSFVPREPEDDPPD